MIAGTREGRLLIDMSSIAPAMARTVAQAASEAGAEMLDAPVSGGDVGAREGSLSIMVGGPDAAFERARPLFDVLGKTVVHLGEAGPARPPRRATRSWSRSRSRP